MSDSFPGGSKGRVNRAGDNVAADVASADDMAVIDEWRAAHRLVLNTFQATLRNRTRGTKIVVAQRHKRKNTIFDKLHRFPGMKLARMDDIAGCRLIFQDIKNLRSFREKFLLARFNHVHKNHIDKYDYIKTPKATGYRGIHDVYEYNVRSNVGQHLKGLLVEIQYRTRIQHAWATTVEVIGHITTSQPKFERGDIRYQEAMALASEVLARAHERLMGPSPNISDQEVAEKFIAIDNEIRLIPTLKGLNKAKASTQEKRNIILVFNKLGELEMYSYRDATEALRRLFEIEKSSPDKDVVLVRADTSEEVRFAYKNYFSDATDFIKLIESGLAKLTKLNKATQRTR